MKTYVVIYQNEAYFFEYWAECKIFIEGKDNILFKGFTNQEEIKKFVDSNIKKQIDLSQTDVSYIIYVEKVLPNKKKTYQTLILKNSDICKKFTIPRKKDEIGELIGIQKALTYLIQEGETRAIIVYDFDGVEMWANHSWKPKRPDAKEYVNFIDKTEKSIAIDFLKVDKESEFYQNVITCN